MSEQRDSVSYLAGLACKMPWEDKAPISARLLFQNAVTPELFCELLRALRGARASIKATRDSLYASHFDPKTGHPEPRDVCEPEDRLIQEIDAILAKATEAAA